MCYSDVSSQVLILFIFVYISCHRSCFSSPFVTFGSSDGQILDYFSSNLYVLSNKTRTFLSSTKREDFCPASSGNVIWKVKFFALLFYCLSSFRHFRLISYLVMKWRSVDISQFKKESSVFDKSELSKFCNSDQFTVRAVPTYE